MVVKSLEIINVSCIKQQRILFSSLDYHLLPGQLLLIEGQNGSGKSSLLRLLNGQNIPATGEIHWQGKSILKHRSFYSQLHYLSHQHGIKLGLTVYENLLLTQHLLLAEKPLHFFSTLEELALSTHLHQPVYQLSMGQKRRLALAKLFLFPKPLWILDEPCTSLDINMQAIFLVKLETHLKSGGLCILSAHQLLPFQRIHHRIRLGPC